MSVVGLAELRISGVELINKAKDEDSKTAQDAYENFASVNGTCLKRKAENDEGCAKCVTEKCKQK